jgi:AcrR family transcriptional regulator
VHSPSAILHSMSAICKSPEEPSLHSSGEDSATPAATSVTELPSSAMDTTPKRPRKSAAESKQLLIGSCIELLEALPIQEVTNAELEARTGLNRSYITRHFGSRNGMFIAVIRELDDRLAIAIDPSGAGAGEMDVPAMLSRPETEIRIRLTMWLLSQGVPAADFVDGDPATLVSIQERIRVIFGLSPKAARAYAFQMLLMSAGIASIGSTFGLTADDVQDVEILVRNQLGASVETARSLGW